MSNPYDPNVPPIQEPPEEPWVAPEPLERLPRPPWLVAFFVAVVLVFIFALTRVPRALDLGVRYERGHKAFEAGDMAKAAGLLAPIVKEFPNAKDVRMDLAEAYARSGEIDAAIQELDTFSGTMVTKEEDDRLNSIASIIDKTLPDAEPGGKE